MNKVIVVACATEVLLPQTEEKARELHLDCAGCVEPKFYEGAEQLLFLTEAGWCIQQTGKKAPGPVRADFASGAVAHRRQFGGGKGQMIAKAVGLGQSVKPSVCDFTAGLGKDGFVLATLGCAVTLVERSPVVHCLLQDGLGRAKLIAEEALDNELENILDRITLYKGDSQKIFDGEEIKSQSQKFDVVYLDPMFPSREKSAQVKKEMVAFQQVVGKDPDADNLLEQALEKAIHRVVVKRPKKAPNLDNQKPTYTLDGKSCRYDIYALKAFS
ncbi:MAG: class I SAM-dependent methyltransferase [Cellvibrionaceae bacterium]